MDNKIS